MLKRASLIFSKLDAQRVDHCDVHSLENVIMQKSMIRVISFADGSAPSVAALGRRGRNGSYRSRVTNDDDRARKFIRQWKLNKTNCRRAGLIPKTPAVRSFYPTKPNVDTNIFSELPHQPMNRAWLFKRRLRSN